MTGDLTARTRTWKDGSQSHYTGRYPRSVLEYQCHEERLHPTQKPQELCEWLVNSYSNADDVVLDFTMGSGTSIHAAKNLNRRYIGIERDETIFEIARRRILGEKRIRDIIKRRNKAGEEVDNFGEISETYGAMTRGTDKTRNEVGVYSHAHRLYDDKIDGDADGLKDVYNKRSTKSKKAGQVYKDC